MIPLGQALQHIHHQQGFRHRRRLQRHSAVTVRDDQGKVLTLFSSNDYLGLAHHPAVIAACQEAAACFGVGSGAAHLVCGHTPPHAGLERDLAAFLGRERALVFSTGYMANVGIVSTLASLRHVVYQDRLNHASLLDGSMLGRTRWRRYPHKDTDQLARWLDAGKPALVVTDGVFSMDGDQAPLRTLARLCEAHQAWLMVDDAHGIGVCGAAGRGSVEQAGLSAAQVPILMATFGKALGTFGAFVAGDNDLIDYLIQKARPYIYTTALPPAIAAATRRSLQLIDEEPWRRDRLRERIRQLRNGLRQLEIPLIADETPIQPLVIGDNTRTLALSEQLYSRGFLVGAIRPPTVPPGSARLRITLSAAHSRAQVDALVNCLGELLCR